MNKTEGVSVTGRIDGRIQQADIGIFQQAFANNGGISRKAKKENVSL